MNLMTVEIGASEISLEYDNIDHRIKMVMILLKLTTGKLSSYYKIK